MAGHVHCHAPLCKFICHLLRVPLMVCREDWLRSRGNDWATSLSQLQLQPLKPLNKFTMDKFSLLQQDPKSAVQVATSQEACRAEGDGQ